MPWILIGRSDCILIASPTFDEGCQMSGYSSAMKYNWQVYNPSINKGREFESDFTIGLAELYILNPTEGPDRKILLNPTESRLYFRQTQPHVCNKLNYIVYKYH